MQILNKATREEFMDQTAEDLLTQDELYAHWRHCRVDAATIERSSVASSQDNVGPPKCRSRPAKPSELLVILDCCYTIKWQERQRKISYRDRDELRCSVVPIRISFNPADFEATIVKTIQ